MTETAETPTAKRAETEHYPQHLRSKDSRATFYRERVGWHIQNINEAKDGLGPIWKHGRIWFYLKQKTVRLEWMTGGRFCHARLTIGDGEENSVGLGVALPFIGAVWANFAGVLPERWMPGRMVESHVRPGEQFKMVEERQIGVSVSNQKLHLDLWYNPWEWNRSDPWWWRISWSPLDTFLGKTQYSTVDMGTTDEVCHLPEGDYPVRLRMFESTWKRPRWLRTQRLMRADVEAVSPIPSHAGKGDNSWDLEDERLYSMTVPATSKEEALAKTVSAILRDRGRYGDPQVS